jgi:protein gp37
MNRTNIEFADFSFNPIVGCRNQLTDDCQILCWARKFNDRYFKNNDFYIPKFIEERLNEKVPGLPKERNEIAKIISPDKPVIFVVDMGDIFSDMVELEWRRKIADYIRDNEEKANFLLLTKRPAFYSTFNVLIFNTFIGTSLDYAHNLKRIEPLRTMNKRGYKTFVNIEPLMSRMDAVDFSGIDFVIVGSLTGRKYIPHKDWHESINHPVIYYKKNYQVYFPELKN